MPESDLFPDVDPGNPIPDDARIIRYMNLQPFMTRIGSSIKAGGAELLLEVSL